MSVGWYCLCHFALSESVYAHRVWNKSDKTWSFTPIVKRIKLQTNVTKFEDCVLT